MKKAALLFSKSASASGVRASHTVVLILFSIFGMAKGGCGVARNLCPVIKVKISLKSKIPSRKTLSSPIRGGWVLLLLEHCANIPELPSFANFSKAGT